MELYSNPSLTSQASGEVENVNTNSVSTNKLTETSPDSPLNSSSKNSGIDLGNEQGSESDESNDTENSSRSNDEDQSSETEFTLIEPDSFTEDMEIIIKNQHKYYLYCPCCGEDITKTVKLVKKSDPKPIKISENKEKGKIEIDINSSGSSKKEKDKPSFPRWFIDVVAWFLLCTVIVLSIFFTSPMKLQLLSMPSLQLPSASAVLLLPMFAVLFMALRFGYSLRFQGEKGDKRVDLKSSNDPISEEESHKDQAAAPGEDYGKKKENQKVHPNPVDSLPEEQEVNKETHEEKTEAEETVLQSNISTNLESCKGSSNKLEILKSIVYGGLTESITSLCTVTSAAASGASTLNVLALGVANLSSGLLLIVHNLQELINEKSRRGANTKEEEDGEDRYEQVLGRREKFRFHSVVVISSFVFFGVIPPLVYGFSFRTKREEEYKILTVYGASLVCVALLSLGKAYVEKRGEYLKTLFRYTTMAMTASGFSHFVGYFVSMSLEKYRFYDAESSQTPAH